MTRFPTPQSGSNLTVPIGVPAAGAHTCHSTSVTWALLFNSLTGALATPLCGELI